jgi:methionine sulfoxide reductase heme-binding subunit
MNWIWIAIRATGLTGYFLLTLSLLMGIYSHIPRKRGSILGFHQIIGQVALLFIGIHAYLLIFDNYEPFSVSELLIPFSASYEPILSGLGTIAVYLLIIVILTSDFMKKVGRSAWKKAHYLVFPLWFLSVIHGLFLGTDTESLWAVALYGGSVLIVSMATIFLVWKKVSQKRKTRTVAT